MREILFRGKLENGGRWSYWNLVVKSDGITIITPDDTPVGIYGKVVPDTVGQYTGLKDKNGTRIFEGDILFWKNTDSFPLVLEWSRAECGFMCRSAKKGGSPYFKMYLDSGDSFEVVGNIHDNPELRGEE